MTRLGQEIELVDLFIAEKYSAYIPANTFLDELLATTQPIENFQRAFRPADRPRADAHRVVFVEHQHLDAATREIDSCRQPDRSGADNDGGPVAGSSAQLWRLDVDVDRVGVGFHRVLVTLGKRANNSSSPRTRKRAAQAPSYAHSLLEQLTNIVGRSNRLNPLRVFGMSPREYPNFLPFGQRHLTAPGSMFHDEAFAAPFADGRFDLDCLAVGRRRQKALG